MKLFLLLFFINIAASFACEMEWHFSFDVSNENEEILYKGCYDAVNLGPHIIEYNLTKERAEAGGIRPNVSFTQDRDGGILRDILEENGCYLPHHSDYSYSGYDRGHMAPNADFNDTYENAMMTFFIANIWPQTPDVNRSQWLITEYETRRLASEYLIVRVMIIVDEFSGELLGDIQIPSSFKKYVYDFYSDELIYEIIVYQQPLSEDLN